MKNETLQVVCPCCANRLFDMERRTELALKIKCQRCKNLISVSSQHGLINTTPVANTKK